jgi:hypothetical protein
VDLKGMTWVKDSRALMGKCKDDVIARSRALVSKLKELKGPASAKPGELEKLIYRVLKEDGARFKDVLALELTVKHDAKSGKLTIDGMAHSGSITSLG